MPVVQMGDKAFPGAGTKPGVEIWRIEFFKPIKVPDKERGKFYKGDSYIILQTIVVDQKANIFFWLGPDSTQDEVGAAAQLAVTLDDELNGFPVQHRVIGGHEDNLFKTLFPHIMMLNGGHESGFQEGKKKFTKMLLQVKGKKNAYASEVALSVDSLNTGDSFVLDCGRTIYAWNGPEANLTEKRTALRFARELRDEERAGLATVCVVDTPEEQEEFFFQITGHKRIVPVTKAASSDDSFDVSNVCNLYRVKEDQGNITMKETGSKPLNRKDLDSDDCFILETSSAVYVWQGKNSSRKEKQVQCHSDAQGFLSARQLNPKTPYKIIKEDLEPTDFKQYFVEWEETVPYGMTKTYTSGRGVATREQLDQRPKFEVRSMHERRKSVVSLLPDDGSGTVQVWRVKNFDLEEVPPASQGVFYSGDCYVVLYTYLKNSKERHIIYFWLGNDSTADEQGTAASRAIALDDSFSGEPYQVRVCEGREPEHFFLIFKHKLVIYQGGHASGFRGTTQQQVTSPDVRLLQVRVTGENSRIVEVAPFAQSLNSSDVFVLHDHHHCYIWVGKGSIGDEKESARNVVHNLGKADVELLREGHEDEGFWKLLGGKAEYASQKQIWEDGNAADSQVTARLFHCSNASGRFRVEEILDFSQDDLEEDDVMILDAWTELFVWIGHSARQEEKRDAIKTAVDYIKTDPRNRSLNMTMSVIKQGAEPLAFKSHFVAWEPQMWNKKMSYEDQLKAIRRDNESVDVNAWTLTEWNEKLKPQFFPLHVLQEKNLPEGVNPTQKELHLEDETFVELFNMTKKEWETFPQWRKNEKKKALKLF